MTKQNGLPAYTFTPRDLARRLEVSEKKLAHDRLAGRGVPYLKIGRLVRYRLVDVIAYEEAQLRLSTSQGGCNRG